MVQTPGGVWVRIPADAKPDAIAYYRNGFKPVLIPSGQLTPSSIPGVATERGPNNVPATCAQPPATLDLLHTPVA